MTDDPVLMAAQRFMDLVEARLSERETAIRSVLADLQTRAAQVGPGAPGKDGRDGKDGEPGKDGRDGATGEKGDAGPAGKDGERGLQGDKGERGADGLQGRDGAPGVQGERGADGAATSEEIEAIIEKRVAEIQVRTLADCYREVYRPGEQYRRGEIVTWGGSLFLAMMDTDDKPETTPAWRLMVKHGRDGRK